MEIPENLLLTRERVYRILTKHKVPSWGPSRVYAAIEELLRAASEAIEVEVEKRLNALAPPGTAPVKLKVSLEVDPTMAASSTVDLEACQRERAARMLAADLLKHLPLSKTTSPRPQMVSDPRRFETWTWEGVIFVKPESKNADSL